jgi:prephenate dehydrogenase
MPTDPPPSTAAASGPVVGIVGVGLMGGSLGLALRRARPRWTVLGVDRPGVLRTALARRAIERGISWRELFALTRAGRLDAVVLALPVPVLLERLPALAAAALGAPAGWRPLVLDTASVKVDVLAAARAACGGIANARADLLRGAAFALCPLGRAPADLAAARDLVHAVRAVPVTLSAHAHDRTVAILSHLPHLLAWSLLDAGEAMHRRVRYDPAFWRLAAGSWASATRVAQADPRLWAGIVAHNRAPLQEALELCLDALGRLQHGLAHGAHVLTDPRRGVAAGRLRARARRRGLSGPPALAHDRSVGPRRPGRRSGPESR